MFTPEQRKYILKNRNVKTIAEMARDLEMSYDTLRYRMRKLDLYPTKRVTIGKMWTEDEIDFIHEHIHEYSTKWIAVQLGVSKESLWKKAKELGYTEVMKKKRESTQFKKGGVPFNKGKKMEEYASAEHIEAFKNYSFKKGNKPHNTLKNGAISLRGDGYLWIRIEESKWELLHKVNWIAKNKKNYNGKTHCLRAIDGNPLNVDPDNWELISRKENLRMNYNKDLPKDLKEIKELSQKLNKIINDKRRKSYSESAE